MVGTRKKQRPPHQKRSVSKMMKPIRKFRRKEATYLNLIDLGEIEDFNLSGGESGLIERVHKIRKKIIRDFDKSDIRICLTQGIGIYYLVPKALDILETEPWVETDHYQGDLFKACISLPNEYWDQNPEDRTRIKKIAKFAKEILPKQDDNSDRQMRKDVDSAIEKFK